jgi:hypothetical protein
MAWVTRSYIDRETQERNLFGTQVDLTDERFAELHAKGLVEHEDKLPKKLKKLFLGEQISEKDKKEALKEGATDPKIAEIVEATAKQAEQVEVAKDEAIKEASEQAEANQQKGKKK